MHERTVRKLIREASNSGVTLWAEDGRLRFKAPKGSMSEALRAALESSKHELIGDLTHPLFRKRDEPPAIVRYPPFWKDSWEENQADPSMSKSLHFALSLAGDITPERIESALKRLTSRHDLLRSRVTLEDGTPCLRLDQDGVVPQSFVDLSAGCAADRSLRVKTAIEQFIDAPFTEGQIYRSHLIKVTDNEYVVAVGIHHFVADAASLMILLQELIASLQGDDRAGSATEERPIQYADYLLGLNEWLQGEGLRYRLEYWREQMRGAPACFPLTQPAQSNGPATFEVTKIPIDEALRARLFRATASAEMPFALSLLAANFAALATTLNCTDLVSIFLHSGRNDPALLPLVGFTINPILIRVTVLPEMSFTDLLASINRAYILATDYQIPWPLLRRSLNEIGVSCVAPFFNYMPVASASPNDRPSPRQGSSLAINHLPVACPERTNSADWKSCEVSVLDSGVATLVTLKHVSSPRTAAIHRYVASFSRCVEMMGEDPARRLGEARRQVS
jgi:hypothetical protein